jgi:hypothetical protein
MHNGSVPRTVAFRARFLSAVNNVVKVGISESKRLPPPGDTCSSPTFEVVL